jgi:hypothetical protein
MMNVRQLRRWGILSLAVIMAACGGGEEEAAKTLGANLAPTISGSPATAIAQGASYVFVPSAADADGDSLTFGIDAKPGWAAFDTASGRLTGSPQAADVGTSRGVTIWVSDGKATTALPAFDLSVSAVATPNRTPAISGTPATSAAAGNGYAFTPTASDADGDALTFSIANKPAWAAFDTATGRLDGTPQIANAGTFADIAIAVSDSQAMGSLPAFSIVVTAPPATNSAPTISGTPSSSATEGAQYSFQPTAADANGDTLTFAIANRPTWATFNANTGRLQGTPAAGNVGTTSGIVMSVSDGKAAATALPAFSITVAAANAAPTISGTPGTTATAGTQYTFTPTSSDANGDTLTFSIANKPAWATFTASNGRLQGTPAAGNVGTTSGIAISVSDGKAAATALPAFSIAVSAAPNRAPTISGTPSTAVIPSSQYSFQPTASDADGDTLTFSIANKPVWATFNTSTGLLQGTPTAGDVGTTSGIVISVSDTKVSAALAGFNLTVTALATGSATLNWTPPTQNTDGTPLTDLAGYKIYWGPSAGSYPSSVTLNNPGLTTYVVGSLVPGTYFFSATALNSAGAESAFASAASKTIL